MEPGQFPALLALFEQDGRAQRELCEVASVDQSTMAKTLARMRRDGLVREEPDPADGRRTRYYLTPRARDLEADLAAAGYEVIALATQGIPADRLTAFDLALLALNFRDGLALARRRRAARSRGPARQARPVSATVTRQMADTMVDAEA